VSGYEVVRLDEIERRDNWIPIRDRLGIRAFGINAYVAGEDGTIVSPHDEVASGHQELYVVLDGTAAFTVDGEEVAAPAGTLVFVRDPASTRTARGDATILALGGKPGEAYEVLDWERAWRHNRDAMRLYREQRYAEAAQVLRDGLVAHPDNGTLHYNLACFAALSGERDEAVEHLLRSIELRAQFGEHARGDDDLDPIRDDPRVQDALRG
jgi:tetratricopeptide (TPR) repeat protein